MKEMSNLKRILDNGGFALTAECGPPKGADPEAVLKKAELLRGKVDAVNVTDNQTAIVRMSSMAACSILKKAGLDPVLQGRESRAVKRQGAPPRPFAMGSPDPLAAGRSGTSAAPCLPWPRRALSGSTSLHHVPSMQGPPMRNPLQAVGFPR